jgi:CheY-like chemotaxis protein
VDARTLDVSATGAALSEDAADRADELASAARQLGDITARSIATCGLAAEAKPSPRRRRIVFADDLEVNRHLLKRFLAREMPDVECFEAADGLQALALVEAHKPDLVLLDLRMPEMDGWQAARRIRALENGRDVPIIALSVTASPGVEAYALHAGCNEFVAKPVSDYSTLVARINHWLRPADPINGGFEPGDAEICVLCRQVLPNALLRSEYDARR